MNKIFLLGSTLQQLMFYQIIIKSMCIYQIKQGTLSNSSHESTKGSEACGHFRYHNLEENSAELESEQKSESLEENDPIARRCQMRYGAEGLKSRNCKGTGEMLHFF